ncbi:hypothetical protein AB0M54_01000 [Actinoplanes sp. NPDC051470]|uniref:hypothetical protein n=1 Tax=Actinoplanes sp. NPDC051470 TaxID=3157224 RepID=UPI003423F6F4
MPDQLSPLFDDLRGRALPQVRPPGPDAARRTVHRRATVRASVLAAVVLAAFGTFVVTQRTSGGTVLPAASASAGPSASSDLEPGRLDEAGPSASSDLEPGRLDEAGPSASSEFGSGRLDKAEVAAALVPGATYTDEMDASGQNVELEAAEGLYRLTVGCSGPASLPFTIMLDDQVDQDGVLDCTDDGEAGDYEFTMPREGTVTVVFDQGGQFDAYALKLTKL